jgi:hypothetical protein
MADSGGVPLGSVLSLGVDVCPDLVYRVRWTRLQSVLGGQVLPQQDCVSPASYGFIRRAETVEEAYHKPYYNLIYDSLSLRILSGLRMFNSVP